MQKSTAHPETKRNTVKQPPGRLRKVSETWLLSNTLDSSNKVFKHFMLAKLHSVDVPDVFLDFLNAYLEPRLGYVTVETALSEVFHLCDTVFQGTVLGPTL